MLQVERLHIYLKFSLMSLILTGHGYAWTLETVGYFH